jgi:hypothetical protein
VLCVRERQREWVRLNRVYERLAARRNATYKGIRIKSTSYAYELIRSTSYVVSSSRLECEYIYIYIYIYI